MTTARSRAPPAARIAPPATPIRGRARPRPPTGMALPSITRRTSDHRRRRAQQLGRGLQQVPLEPEYAGRREHDHLHRMPQQHHRARGPRRRRFEAQDSVLAGYHCRLLALVPQVPRRLGRGAEVDRPLKFTLAQHSSSCFGIIGGTHSVSRTNGATPICFTCHNTMNATAAKPWGVNWAVGQCAPCHNDGRTATCR